MKPHKTTISNTAQPGLRKPKKISDQNRLSSNCTPKIASATCTCGLPHPCRHTSQAATPIRMYSSVHTGPNTQFGGFHVRLLRPWYQVGMDGAVAAPPS